jgi:hypothetical protein
MSVRKRSDQTSDNREVDGLILFAPSPAPVVRGLIVIVEEALAALGLLAEPQIMSQGQYQEIAREVANEEQVQINEEEHCRTVIKVCDAERAVEEAFNNPAAIALVIEEFAARLGQTLIGHTRANPFKPIAEQIKMKFQQYKLPQDSSRSPVTYRYWKRAI